MTGKLFCHIFDSSSALSPDAIQLGDSWQMALYLCCAPKGTPLDRLDNSISIDKECSWNSTNPVS
jgi:hypothetical protein